MVQGQFCGDCLYMRYGEHVLEALENPNWTCPVCRGICNCSLCRQSKGLAPTGILYRKISQLGYKSVAHYLIQTKCPENNAANSSDEPLQASAKRSLPFSNSEEPPNSELHTASKTEEHKLGSDVALKTEEEECKLGSDTPVANREKKVSPCSSSNDEVAAETESYPEFVSATPAKYEGRRGENKRKCVVEEELVGEKTADPKKKVSSSSPSAIKPASPDSVGARVRQRRRTTNGGE
ncbi:Cell division cycle-associated 7-like protein [Linum grandiflorum]